LVIILEKKANNMKITAADVGRKVVLRNGTFNTIVDFSDVAPPYYVRLHHGIIGRYKNGTVYGKGPDPLDIIAFADELETKQDTPTKTLRDEIAIEVLKCLMKASKVTRPEGTVTNAAEFPEIAYAFADAMMAAREGKTNESMGK
jgi:hypothetical protein